MSASVRSSISINAGSDTSAVSSEHPITGLVFDLDGTLIHSAPDIAAALNAILAECGLPVFEIEQTYRFVGAGAKRLITDAFQARGRALSDNDVTALTARYLDIYAQSGSPNTTLYPGVRETLATIANMDVPMAVCTNKAEAISRTVLTQLGLHDAFSAIIGSDSGFGRKPEPGPLQECCRRIDVSPTNVLMIGDTVMDAGSARAAGTRIAIVRYGYSQVPLETIGADLLLEHFSALSDLVTRP